MSAVETFPKLKSRCATPFLTMRMPSRRYTPGMCFMAVRPSRKFPTVDEMCQRMKSVTDSGLPWLVALYRGIVVGYCYATFYRPRQAYRYTLEESIYVDASTTGRGFGSALLQALIARCEQGPWRQMIAVVGDGQNNPGSLRLHKKHGFEIVGQLRSVGYKKATGGTR